MKKLIIVLNTTIPFGRALNAAAHTVLGMGHRIPEGKMPNIHVLTANNEAIREFRQAANQICTSNPESVLYADFTSTMIGGTTDEQLVNTSSTPEAEMDYFAISICADESVLTSLAPILEKLTSLPKYKSQINTPTVSQFDFLPAAVIPNNHDPIYRQYATHKAAVVFNKKQDIDESINAMIAACLDVGQRANLMALHLLMYIDADGGKHPNISYHAFPIVTTKNQGKLEMLATEVGNDNSLISRSVSDENGSVNVVCIFGEAAALNIYTKQCSLWTREVVSETEIK